MTDSGQVIEARSRVIFEHGCMGILLSTPDGMVQAANPEACRILGRSADDFPRLSRSELVDTSDPRLASALEERARTGHFRGELCFLRPDGSSFPVEVASTHYRDQDGELRTLTIFYDLTDRHRAEAELRSQRAALANLVEGTHAGTWTWDVQTGKAEVNDRWATMLGYTVEELSPITIETWRGLVHPEDIRVSDAARDAHFSGAAVVYECEFRMRHKDGSWVWMLDRGKVVEWGPGRTPLVMAGVHLDITERRRLAESHMRLATAVEQAEGTIVVTDKDGTILYANPAFERASGYSRSEVIGSSFRILKSGKHDREFYREMWGCLLRGETWKGHFVNRRKDGTLYDEQTTISPIRNEQGEIVNYVAVKRDVTRELQLEAQFRQAQKLEVLGQLAGGIAHDFNNILAVILGNVELAVLDVARGHPARTCLDAIAKAGNRAKGLVEQILTYSRQQPQDRRVLDLEPILAEAVRFLRATLSAEIEIILEVEAGLPAILADPTQIHQVIFNLGTNALHALEGGPGRIVIGLRAEEVTEATVPPVVGLPHGRYVCISVSDSGQGMASATLERIFDPFFTTKAPGKGTGLGLSVVQGIVASHEGAITVLTQPGQGTTFKVYFPCASVPAPQATAPERCPPMGGGRHVLFLDDEDDLLLITRRLLERSGYRVTGFTRVAEAMEAFRAAPDSFDIVVTDLSMPVASGMDVARDVLALRPLMPVVVCSGHVSEKLRQQAHAIGVRQVLTKPCTVEELSETLHRLTVRPGAS